MCKANQLLFYFPQTDHIEPSNTSLPASAQAFPDLPDDGVADQPVYPVVEVALQPVRLLLVVPRLHPDVGHQGTVEPVPPLVDVAHLREVDGRLRDVLRVARLISGVVVREDLTV